MFGINLNLNANLNANVDANVDGPWLLWYRLLYVQIWDVYCVLCVIRST
jgi:hypothetical protein